MMPVNYEAQQGEMLAYNQASRWAVSYPPCNEVLQVVQTE